MRIPVSINIKTKKKIVNPLEGKFDTENREYSAFGYLSDNKNRLMLEYNSPTEPDDFTKINLLDNNSLAMSTGSTGGVYLIFEKGKTNFHVFDNGQFPMELRVKTNELTSTITKSGGTLDLDYSIDIIGSRAEDSHLFLSVSPHSDPKTS